MKEAWDDVRKLLKDNGYKFTNQRWEVYRVFENNKEKHLSSEEVFDIVSKENDDIGIATVYRTVQLFEELGVLYRITFDDGVARYELKDTSEAHYHHHLICLNCNKVIEVELDLLDNLEEEIEKLKQFKIVDHNLKFYGYCEDCKDSVKGEKNEKQ
ncbi:MAG: Fur family transcriptional regulator [Tissierellia bacterium]|nr:Fur family transcriptional regulator [Tissierellia bacterium]